MSILRLLVPSIFDHADGKKLGVDSFKSGRNLSSTYFYLAVLHYTKVILKFLHWPSENRVKMFQMKPALKKSMFHLAWSPDSLPTTDAITPLLEYLDNHLIALNSALLPRNFERVMSLVWDTCVTELAHQMDGHSQDKLPGFYDRLYEALDILAEFFHADGKGLGVDGLKTGKN